MAMQWVDEKDLKRKINAWRRMRFVHKRQRCRRMLGFCERAGVWGFQGAGVPEIQDEGELCDVSSIRVSSPSYSSLVQSNKGHFKLEPRAVTTKF